MKQRWEERKGVGMKDGEGEERRKERFCKGGTEACDMGKKCRRGEETRGRRVGRKTKRKDERKEGQDKEKWDDGKECADEEKEVKEDDAGRK